MCGTTCSERLHPKLRKDPQVAREGLRDDHELHPCLKVGLLKSGALANCWKGWKKRNQNCENCARRTSERLQQHSDHNRSATHTLARAHQTNHFLCSWQRVVALTHAYNNPVKLFCSPDCKCSHGVVRSWERWRAVDGWCKWELPHNQAQEGTCAPKGQIRVGGGMLRDALHGCQKPTGGCEQKTPK